MKKVILPVLIMGGFIMVQKSVWAKSGDIDPEFVRGIVKSVKAIENRTRGLPVPLIMGFVATESSFRTKVVSSAGAVGLMQVKPSTYKWLMEIYPNAPWQGNGLENPIENVLAGMMFLTWINKQGLSFFGGIQAYNTGVAGYKKGTRALDYGTKVLINSFAFIL